MSLPFLPWPHELLEGPYDVGSEQRFLVRLADGRRAVVGQLAPDLARDESIRRRWVRDAERVRALEVPFVVPTLEIGPAPDPRTPGPPPWRVRLDPDGEPLSRWLARAPVTLEEFTSVFAAVGDALAAVHATGAVLRDLRPEQILLLPDRRAVLIDVGLSRVDVLSSHTASSLLLQGSAYSAPEQVRKTAVDPRSDLFGLGVMMWQALTGSLPYGDGPAFLRSETELPSLSSARADVPASLDLLVRACLHPEPERRPATCSDVQWVLRGGAATSLVEQATTMCQHCGARLRVGQRLCIECGRLSVKFTSAAPGQPLFGLDLLTVGEDAGTLKWLQGTIRELSQPPFHAPEFLIGSTHLYSDEEKAQRIRLPARLYNGLSEESAQQLRDMMAEHGLAVAVVGKADVVRAGAVAFVALAFSVGAALLTYLVSASVIAASVVLGIGAVAFLLLVSRYVNTRTWVHGTFARYQLRALPAALPASDPLVARLAALLRPDTPADVRAAVGELALLVQRLVDHRAQFVRDRREIDMLTAPVEPLVACVESRVHELGEIGRELADLDEGAMVRALAAADARGDAPDRRWPILEGLDRLRALEDRRAAVFQRLLQAKSLLTRTVELGLAQHDDAQEHERSLALAIATLGG